MNDIPLAIRLGFAGMAMFPVVTCRGVGQETTPTMPPGFTTLKLEQVDIDQSIRPHPFTADLLINGIRYNAYAVNIYQMGDFATTRLDFSNRMENLAEIKPTIDHVDARKDLPDWVVQRASDTFTVTTVIRENKTPTVGASPQGKGFPRVFAGTGSGRLSILDDEKPKVPMVNSKSNELSMSYSQLQGVIDEALKDIVHYSTDPAKLGPDQQ